MRDIDKELYQRIDEILCYIWDPIEVSRDGTPQTRDEYTSYVGKVHTAVKRGDNTQQIATILDGFITKSIGIESQYKHCEEIAAKIITWSNYLKS